MIIRLKTYKGALINKCYFISVKCNLNKEAGAKSIHVV